VQGSKPSFSTRLIISLPGVNIGTSLQ
jgi:hypothetical protein